MFNKAEKTNARANGAPIALLRESNFETEVLQSKEPVLVAFWAPWSRPCRVLDPILHDLARACAGKAKVAKFNADDCLELSLSYDIQSIPTLLYFVEGRPRLRIVGTATKQAILAKLSPFGVTNEPAAFPEGASRSGRQPGKEN